MTPGSVKRAGSVDPPGEVKKARYSSGAVGSPDPATKSTESSKPIEKSYCDAVVNFLLRIACQVIHSFSIPFNIYQKHLLSSIVV